nr:unnamed protein product [Spirometra erinaceieuropaei]
MGSEWQELPLQQPAYCLQPVESGHGSENTMMFGFDALKNDCVQFIYKGSGGNENRFATKSACMLGCLFELAPH